MRCTEKELVANREKKTITCIMSETFKILLF